MACPHRRDQSVNLRRDEGGVAPHSMARCALVDALGLPSALSPEHCERCLADANAPGTLASAINRDLTQHLLMRRIQSGDGARHPKLLALDAAVERARVTYGQAFVEDALVEAVRRGRLTSERALSLAGEEPAS